MYTQFEKYMAIRYLITQYAYYKEEEFNESQQIILYDENKNYAVRNTKFVNKIVVKASKPNKIKEELLCISKTFKGINSIMRKFEQNEEYQEMIQALDKYSKENEYSQLLADASYYFIKDHRFHSGIELSADPKVIESEISKMFANPEMKREWKVVYSIILESIPSSPKFQELVQARQLAK